MLVEPKDPLDADAANLTAKIGAGLHAELDELAKKRGRSLNAVVNQFLKWLLRHPDLVKPRDPRELNPKSTSLRFGAKFRQELEALAAKKNLNLSELIIEGLKLGLREEKK